MPSPGPGLIGTHRWRGLAPGPAGGCRLTSEAAQLDNNVRGYLKKKRPNHLKETESVIEIIWKLNLFNCAFPFFS